MSISCKVTMCYKLRDRVVFLKVSFYPILPTMHLAFFTLAETTNANNYYLLRYRYRGVCRTLFFWKATCKVSISQICCRYSSKELGDFLPLQFWSLQSVEVITYFLNLFLSISTCICTDILFDCIYFCQ
jgi:hypothetical protein